MWYTCNRRFENTIKRPSRNVHVMHRSKNYS